MRNQSSLLQAAFCGRRGHWLARTALTGLGAAFIGAAAPSISATPPPANLVQVMAAAHFEEPLLPAGETSEAENAALLQALDTYRTQTAKDDFSPFEDFLHTYPTSAWRVALHADMGLLDYHYGYFSRAMDHWQQAWDAGRTSTDPRMKALVDRVAGELLRMHARLGHADAIETLIGSIGDRKLTGQATEELTGAREGLYIFRHNPGIGYLCGPMALKNLLLALGRPADQVSFLDDYRSGKQGVSLEEVATLAEKAKLDFHLVHRDADQPIPIPSIVHWKLSHFAAIIGEKDGRYHIKDPTFGHDLWVARGALDTETSGYFLVLGKPGNGPWRQVAAQEAASVRGMGQTANNDPDDDTPDDPPCDCGGGSNASGISGPSEADSGDDDSGMTRYAFGEMLNSLKLQDSPVGYTPPKGPAVPVTLTYNQREASQPANFSFYNVSPKWTLNWLAYIQDDPTNTGGNVSRIVGGGGSITESGYNAATGGFTMEEKTGAVLAYVQGATPGYTLTFTDGSVNTYSTSNGATTYPRIMFLTSMADRYGNALTFTYDAQYRLTQIKDATARLTKFAYNNASFPLQVTKVTDPFGRLAQFVYDSTGRLTQITDVLGLVSKYTYDSTSLVNSLTTPYGTTNFSYGDNGNSRYLQATDPLGNTERVEYIQGAPGIPFSDPTNTVPTGIINPFNQYLNDRDTFYWDKHAYAVAAGNYTQARNKHWVHLTSNTNITGGVVESIKRPLENRIWFNYPGQPVTGGLGTAQNGTFDSPSRVGRVLDNGTTQLAQIAYNTLGNLTSKTDPVGRQTQLTYAANNIDLATVQQQTSSGMATIAQFGSYVKHLPQTYTDASGQVWNVTYNAAGQITQTTDPLGKITKYTYNSLGYPLTVVNQNSQTSVTYTYDSFSRPATITDSEGHTVSYTYDAFDRVTQETYPDATTRKYVWKNLDLMSVTDRQGRIQSFTYDANRNMISSTDAIGNVTHFGYWENNKLKTLTDGTGNVTNWNIDIESRPTSKVFADGSTTTYGYEATTSRVKSVTDPLAQIKQYSYTVDNMVSGISYQNAVNATPSVSYTYDPYFARLASITDGSGTTNFNYVAPGANGAMQLLQEIGPVSAARLGYVRDVLGRPTIRRVGGNPETFSYDALGRPVTTANDLGEFNLSYLGQTGQVTALQGSGIGTQWTYDTNAHDRRLLSINNGPNARSFAYTTTAENDITGITETLGSVTQSWTDGYDKNDRLSTASLSTGTNFTYTYDKSSNIASIKTGGVTTNLTYTTLNQLQAFNGKAFAYDANGNLTQDDKRTYKWDAENRLVGVGFLSQPGVTETFRYDGRNHRIASVVTNGSVTTETHYFWCGETLCQARNARDKVIRRYFAEGEEAPAAGTILYYGKDQNSTIRDVLSAQTGSLVASTDYDPIGNVIKTSGQTATDFGYAGLVNDAQSGLYLASYRQYDGRVGRFTSRDPAAEFGGINLYAYGRGNPISYVDPQGLAWQIGVSLTGTIIVPGFGASGGGTIGINFDGWNSSLFGNVQANGGIGGGAYVGWGAGLGGANGPSPTTGGTVTKYVEGDAGYGLSGGVNGSVDDCGNVTIGANGPLPGVKLGEGFGLGAFGGYSATATYATPTIGDIGTAISNGWDSLSNAWGNLNQGIIDGAVEDANSFGQ